MAFKSDNFTRSNRENSNIDIAILNNSIEPKLFRCTNDILADCRKERMGETTAPDNIIYRVRYIYII